MDTDTQHPDIPQGDTPPALPAAGLAGAPPAAVPHAGLADLPQIHAVDLWQGFRLGTDESGASVRLDLALSSMLVGGAACTDTTPAARIPALAAALDPHVRLVVFDGADAPPDWQAFAGVAHRFGSGTRPGTTAALARCLEDLVSDLDWRYQTLRDLPDADCPDGHLTPALARNTTVDLGLVVVVVDAVGHYLADPELGATIGRRLAELATTGPAAGISLVLGAQPAWAWLPMRLLDAMRTRFALATHTPQDSEAILGGGARAAGLDASTLPETSPGLGILRQEGGPGRLVQADPYPLVAVRRLCERARELRIEAGTLSGDAADQDQEARER